MSEPTVDDAAAIASRVTSLLDRLEVDTGAALAGGEDLVRRLRDSSVGGKAFRGRLLLAAFDACAGTDREAALDLAAAVELFQTAALIHDDVLDGSDTRRGRPAAHRAFEAEHGSDGLVGDPAAYGRAGAILAGDVALITAQRAATVAGSRVGYRVVELFARMAVLVTAGQHLDMRVASTPLDDLAALEVQIRATLRSKTASYTSEYPLALGVAAAGADDATVAAVAAAGVPLGVAFQLRDDVLGLAGDARDTGKPVGDDLREGKRTLLVWHALTHGDAADRDAVLAVLGHADAGGTAIAAAIDALRRSGAFDAVEREIEREAAEARDRLADCLPRPAAVEALVDAAVRRVA